MGGINRALFGGSKQKSGSTSTASSESGNIFADFIKSKFEGATDRFDSTSGQLMKLLGLGGDGDQEAAYQTFRSTPGYQFARDEGLSGVQGKFSGSGMLGSGARDKAMLKYGTGLADQNYGSYMDRLFNMGNQQLGAGQLVSGAGQFSNSNSTNTSFGKGSSSNGGLGTLVGAFLGSERGIKENIVKIGELDDGLGIYEYEYNVENKHWGEGTQTGVMVDEVRKFRPWALGPVINGVQTVDYSKLEGDI